MKLMTPTQGPQSDVAIKTCSQDGDEDGKVYGVCVQLEVWCLSAGR